MSEQIELFTLPQFTFDNPIVSMIVDLEKLRVESLSFLTRYAINNPDGIFSTVKQLFKALESVGSARIEGNNTTIAEYLIQNEDITESDENVLEIRNIEMVISRLDCQYKALQKPCNKSVTMSTFEINHQFIKEFLLHDKYSGINCLQSVA